MTSGAEAGRNPCLKGSGQEELPNVGGQGRWLRGDTQRPRSGAEAGRTPCPKGSGQEELPQVQGQGRWPRGDTQCPRSGAMTRGVTPRLRSGAAAGRRYPTPLSLSPGLAWKELPHAPTPEARGGRREEQPHAQGQGQWPGGPTPGCGCAGQEGLEELSDVEGQEGQR